MITHAIGDQANDQVLRTYKKVMKDHELVDPRFRIEHFQVIHDVIRTSQRK